MHRRAPFLVSLVALATIGAAPLPNPAIETIKVSVRFPFAVCTGVCPNYDLQVRADGRVELRRLSFDGADEYRRFRVSDRKAAEFFHRLDTLRPAGGGEPRETHCGAGLSPDEARLHIDVKELEIVWIDAQRAQHLEECETAERMDTLGDALRAVGLHSDGSRMEG
jgi:hypothetical protein